MVRVKYVKLASSAPDDAALGALNSYAQTLSASSRAVGPFLSGGVFTLCVTAQPNGEILAFALFAVLSSVSFLMSFGIRTRPPTADAFEVDSDPELDDDDADDNGEFSEIHWR